MKVAIYARVSTKDKGQDVENQLLQLREFCKSRGYEIFKEYFEQVTGTGKEKRPVFEQMLKDARLHKFDAVLVWSYDRFSRGGLKDLKYILWLNDWNVKFISLQEPFLDTTSDIGELLIPIFAWVAKQEAKSISERVKAGLVKARMRGKRIGRAKIEVDVQKIKELREKGLSLRQIAKEMKISHTQVARVLKNL